MGLSLLGLKYDLPRCIHADSLLMTISCCQLRTHTRSLMSTSACSHHSRPNHNSGTLHYCSTSHNRSKCYTLPSCQVGNKCMLPTCVAAHWNLQGAWQFLPWGTHSAVLYTQHHIQAAFIFAVDLQPQQPCQSQALASTRMPATTAAGC